jgi:iron-sulfur cluster assembly protein
MTLRGRSEALHHRQADSLPAGKEDEAMAELRPRPQVMRLTDAAAARIKEVMAKADGSITGVRVGVKNGGCAGMAYTMEYATQIGPYDEIVEDKGVRILIDPKAVMFLLGTEMDFKTDKLATQFVFNNPNQTSACGCGESVQLTPATTDGTPAASH